LKIKALVFQEVRLLRLKQSFTPLIIIDEVSRSIYDTKRDIVRLTKYLSYKERNRILKRLIREVVDEEIDRAVQLRSNRCLRCIHGRFYDRSEKAYSTLPNDEELVEAFGCDRFRLSKWKKCRRFIEISTATPIEDYIVEMNILYEIRDMIDRINEIWKDYFLL
jgi:hypothetical protein